MSLDDDNLSTLCQLYDCDPKSDNRVCLGFESWILGVGAELGLAAT
jgi:hypothetical protein